ncbi:DUF371 domain-containing protein [archaeon]|nr:DUF371 domain-containing protein [archaeon]
MQFTCTGHTNITAEHSTTIEVTKDNSLTEYGDCIIGVNADFNHEELMSFVEKTDRAKIIFELEELKEEITGQINKEFKDEHEIVLRTGKYISDRTLLTHCDKAAKDLSRDLIDKLKQGKKMKVNLINA